MTPTYSFKYLKSLSGSTKAKSVPSTMIINGSTKDYPTEILKESVNHFIPQVESTLVSDPWSHVKRRFNCLKRAALQSHPDSHWREFGFSWYWLFLVGFPGLPNLTAGWLIDSTGSEKAILPSPPCSLYSLKLMMDSVNLMLRDALWLRFLTYKVSSTELSPAIFSALIKRSCPIYLIHLVNCS